MARMPRMGEKKTINNNVSNTRGQEPMVNVHCLLSTQVTSYVNLSLVETEVNCSTFLFIFCSPSPAFENFLIFKRKRQDILEELAARRLG